MPTNSTAMSTLQNNVSSKRRVDNDNTLINNNQDQTIAPEPKPSTNTNINRHNTETDSFQSSSCNTMIELSSESSDTMIVNENGTEIETESDSQQHTLKVNFLNKISTNYDARVVKNINLKWKKEVPIDILEHRNA